MNAGRQRLKESGLAVTWPRIEPKKPYQGQRLPAAGLVWIGTSYFRLVRNLTPDCFSVPHPRGKLFWEGCLGQADW